MKNFFLATLLLFSYSITRVFSFSDIPVNYENKEAVEYLRNEGFVEGYSDGTFRPYNTINRAEFLKILLEVMQDEYPDVEGGDCFPDVTHQWFAKYVCYAKLKEIIDGYPDGYFRPEQEIAFAEAAKIIASVFNTSSYVFPDDIFWYRPFIVYLSNENSIAHSIMGLQQKITRGEMAEIVWRLKAGISLRPGTHFYFYEDGSFDIRTRLSRLYTKGSGSIYFNDRTISVDVDTFEALGDGYARDKSSGYRYGSKIQGSDGKTFEYLGRAYFNAEYSKDKNNVYFNDFKIIGADPESFVYLQDRYSKDKNAVYLEREKVEDADPNSFEILRSETTSGHSDQYAKDKKFVYVWGDKLEGSDIATFEVLEKGYAKDKNFGYFRGKVVMGSDGETFKYLGGSDVGGLYAADKNSIYLQGSKFADNDGNSFQFLENGYAKDTEFVYFKMQKIDSADPNSFQILVPPYARDTRFIYLGNKRIEDSDPDSFAVIENQKCLANLVESVFYGVECFYYLVKDKNSVYLSGQKFAAADAATFTIPADWEGEDEFNAFYARDIDSVYFITPEPRSGEVEVEIVIKEVPFADPSTFEYLADLYSQDSHRVYFGENILGESDGTFKNLGWGYAKDKNSVYYRGRKMWDADVDSFEVSGNWEAKDKWHYYKGDDILR